MFSRKQHFKNISKYLRMVSRGRDRRTISLDDFVRDANPQIFASLTEKEMEPHESQRFA